MQTNITIDDQQLKSLMFFTPSNNETDAIYKVIQAYLLQAKQRQDILALRGQVDMADKWQALCELEINK